MLYPNDPQEEGSSDGEEDEAMFDLTISPFEESPVELIRKLCTNGRHLQTDLTTSQLGNILGCTKGF